MYGPRGKTPNSAGPSPLFVHTRSNEIETIEVSCHTEVRQANKRSVPFIRTTQQQYKENHTELPLETETASLPASSPA